MTDSTLLENPSSSRGRRNTRTRAKYGRSWRRRAAAAYLLSSIVIVPVFWLVLTAFKVPSETFSQSLGPLTLDNFEYVLTQIPLLRYMLNTGFVAVVVTSVALFFHSMAAFSLARLSFRGSGIVFNVVIATLMVSWPVILVPLYLIVRELGLLDSLWAVIVPGVFNAFGIFLLRQVMVGVPVELEESATIDGCGFWGRYRLVVLPLVKPTMVSLGVLFFLANWNAFMWPRTVLSSQEIWMVQQGLSAMQGQYSSAWNYIVAAAVLVAIPTTLLFLAGQRSLVDSIKTSGLK